MTKLDKLKKKFLSKPKDFTYEELVLLLKFFGYTEISSGKTSGLAKKFKNKDNDLINFHKPHPGNIVKGYVFKQIIEKFERNGIL